MKIPVAVAIPVLSLFLALSSTAVQGGIYKWTDAKGIVHFSNTPAGNAASVEDDLPPASSFTAPSEPSPTTETTEPASETPTSPPATVEVPPAEGEPTAVEPPADEEPVPAGSEPAGIEEESPTLVPQAAADLLAPPIPDDSAQDELDVDASLEADETGEEPTD